MAKRLVMWAPKSLEAEALPPFNVSCKLGDAQFGFDGSLKPKSIKIQVSNVPLNEGIVTLFNKFGYPGQDPEELVIDTDKVTMTDILPFVLHQYCEFLIKTQKKVEIPKEVKIDPTLGEDECADKDEFDVTPEAGKDESDVTPEAGKDESDVTPQAGKDDSDDKYYDEHFMNVPSL